MSISHTVCLGEHLVGHRGGGKWRRELLARLASQADVLVHQLHVEPGLAGLVEHQRYAGLEHRRADRAFGHDLGGAVGIDPVTFGEQQPLGEGEHLYREADVDRELEHESLAALTDVLGRSEDAQDRLEGR